MIKRPLNSRFRELVLSGKKTTTIRDKAWPVGVPIMLYSWSGQRRAVRTGGYCLAAINAPSAPQFGGQLARGKTGAFSVWERFGDGSAIIRNFDDEYLAMQCAVALGTRVEPLLLENTEVTNARDDKPTTPRA